MDTRRLILFLILSFSVLMLWDAWEREHAPHNAVTAQQSTASRTDVPAAAAPAATPVAQGYTLAKGQRVHVKTDMVIADIDTVGGDLRHLELVKHKDTEDKSKNFVLFDDSAAPKHLYVSQSGFTDANLPNHKSVFTSQASSYELVEGSDKLEVRLSWNDGKGVQVDKVYTFHRGSYVVDLNYDIKNGSAAPLSSWVYYQLVHDSQSSQGSKMMPTFTGAAYFTDVEKYKKLKFSDMEKSDLQQNAKDGWIGVVQHYFAGAWIPKAGSEREFYTKKLGGELYSVGVKLPLTSIAAGANAVVGSRLFAGPQEQKHLEEVAPGLEYTVDYGWLTIIATPLFWLLSTIQKMVHNWGVAIILLTVLIKLAFYPLSAASYRSMAQMRKLAPRLQSLKERYGDDKAKFQQAMMELYKTEKINPMGGCLPIIVQIPVFIALYWVLLGSVEMRQAPFMLWIQDLSASDPYYVLPIVMGISMIIQTKLNPTPPDPIQAKVMMIMPVAFSVFFFFFPAGLVLYWLVNNVLSIAQQWTINRTMDGAGKA
jgi:YidC/Oxa1 family membrane protein insertase